MPRFVNGGLSGMGGDGHDEWGPWVEHDGHGCPVVGQYVAVIIEGHPGNFMGPIECIAGSKGGGSWDWKLWLTRCMEGGLIGRVTRYRVRKPRALLDLIELVENLPKQEDTCSTSHPLP